MSEIIISDNTIFLHQLYSVKDFPRESLSDYASTHLEDFFNLTAIWSEGVRFSSQFNGGRKLDMSNFFRSPKTLDFMCLTEASLGLMVDRRNKNESKSKLKDRIQSPLVCATKGKGGKTIAHKAVCLYVASMFNPLFFMDLCSKLSDIENIISAINDFEVDEDMIRDQELYVYVIRNEETKKIKIGITKDPEERLSNLQTANHAQLILVATKKVSSRAEERYFHQMNSQYHIRGEWFECQATIK